MKQFEENGAQLLGLSADPVASLKAWATSMGGINYPLLSDFWPHGAALSSLGLFNDERGIARRSLVVIDKEGKVRHVSVYQGTLPEPQEALDALQAL